MQVPLLNLLYDFASCYDLALKNWIEDVTGIFGTTAFILKKHDEEEV